MVESKVILVNPPLSKEERYGFLASAGSFMPPLGLGSLASVLRSNGYVVKILDSEALGLTITETIDEIISFAPTFLGITAVTVSIFSAADVVKGVKQIDDSICSIIGGPHLSAVPDETMKLFPDFEVGVIGEGEITLMRLLEAISSKGSLHEVEGIIFRFDGKLITTEPRNNVDDLDSFEFPAWDLLPDLRKYYQPSAFGFKKLPCTSLVTARGCYGTCSFCNQGVWGKRYREHSAQYVFDMIKELYCKYGIRDLAIYDGVFGVNKKRLVTLCEMLIKEKLDLVWSCNFRAEMANPEILRLMKKAGCWNIAYGIESCSDEVLSFIKKGVTFDMIKNALRYTKEAGITSKGYIMVGTLNETVETCTTTLNNILKLDLDILTVNSFTPFPGTLDYERADQYGSFNRNWRLLNEHSYVFVPSSMTQEQVEGFVRLITKKFYLRPSVIFRYFIMFLNPRYFKLLFIGFISFLKFVIFKSKTKKESGVC
ncbi:B12-binding domain-containing radical SAM protein [Candidatus Omnitrophota bacterium]